jgi:hypothetical protein
LVTVAEVGGIETAGAPLDNGGGDLDDLRIDLATADLDDGIELH